LSRADWLLLGHRLAPPALAGMAAIVGGLVLVFRQPARRVSASG
jgi:drug/metabolite transporter (DMT)-like permease